MMVSDDDWFEINLLLRLLAKIPNCFNLGTQFCMLACYHLITETAFLPCWKLPANRRGVDDGQR